MRRLVLSSVLLVFLIVVVLPVAIVKGCGPGVKPPRSIQSGISITVWLHESRQTVVLDLEEYIKGVVAAEMPALFETEALKAQAVAARTYAVKRLRRLGGQGYPSTPPADVTSDGTQGQAYLTQEALKARWGPAASYANWQRVSAAVEATMGLVMTCNGLPIDAAYHSTCGGGTERAEDVWSNAVPYLRAVSCVYCGHSPRRVQQVSFTYAELERRLQLDAKAIAALMGNQGKAVVERTASGRVKTVRMGDRLIAGTELRRLLELRSTRVTWQLSATGVTFATVGYGHGVGLCQYGADGLAKLGKGYQEILKFYYTGVQVEPIFAD